MYDTADLPGRIQDGHYTLAVEDGFVRGISGVTMALLVAVLRIDADLTELTDAVLDITEAAGEQLAALGGSQS